MKQSSRWHKLSFIIISTLLVILFLGCNENSSNPVTPRGLAGDCSCSANLYNCADFTTQANAQACFEHCMALGFGDIHDLDRDNDNLACEESFN